MIVSLLSIVIGIAILAGILSLPSRRKGKKLPPGPSGLPIIGNLHQAPTENPWRIYQEWSKKYGPIFSLKYGMNTIIILGNHQAARDLLDKRSGIYSSRPRVVMGGECVSKGLRTLLMPYGPQWRLHQRLQASYLNIRISQAYCELQDVESKQLIYEMLSTSDFSDRYHRYSSSLIFALAYGRRLPTGDEPEIKAIDQVMENFLYAARVGTWVVDALPVLNYLPGFLAPWKEYAAKLHNHEARLYVDNMEGGRTTQSWNWSKQVREMKEGHSMPPKELAYDVGITYEAGSDTTTMALEVFTLAMILYPGVMTAAQEELDAVVGSARLPSFADKAQLVYIDAIVKEVLRWRPVSAGGIPHAVIQDDEYMGYHIPQGATVIGNHWSIHLDEDVYKDPYDFVPERWIENPNLPLSSFGFGRRVCTGQHIAKNSLFINISRLLWMYNIGYAYEICDGRKQRIEVDPFAFTQGFNSRPMPFKANFQIRSSERESIARREWENAEKDVDVILRNIKSSQ